MDWDHSAGEFEWRMISAPPLEGQVPKYGELAWGLRETRAFICSCAASSRLRFGAFFRMIEGGTVLVCSVGVNERVRVVARTGFGIGGAVSRYHTRYAALPISTTNASDQLPPQPLSQQPE